MGCLQNVWDIWVLHGQKEEIIPIHTTHNPTIMGCLSLIRQFYEGFKRISDQSVCIICLESRCFVVYFLCIYRDSEVPERYSETHLHLFRSYSSVSRIKLPDFQQCTTAKSKPLRKVEQRSPSLKQPTKENGGKNRNVLMQQTSNENVDELKI